RSWALDAERDQISLAGPRLRGNDRGSIGREIRAAQPRTGRQPSNAAVGPRKYVEIVVEPHVAPDLRLIEIDLVAADRRRRSQIPSRQTAWRRAVELYFIERRKVVRVGAAVDDSRRAAGARKPIESRSAGREAVMRELRQRIAGRRWRNRSRGSR